jgi:AcrR family transcriptional regulator
VDGDSYYRYVKWASENPMVRRTQELAEETRQAVLAAARRQFETTGYAASSLSAIAEEAGITKGGLFHHFANKEELFLEVWTDLQVAMDTEARAAATAARSKTDPYAAFLAGCRTYLGWSSRPDYQQIVLIDGPSVLGVKRWHTLDRKLGEDNVRTGVEWLVKKGVMSGEDTGALSVLIQSALNGAGFALARQEPGVTPCSMFDSFERLVRGLR